MKTTTAKLLEAAIVIAQMKGKEVTAIQFEDGSGNNFNYQLDNGPWEFISLRDHGHIGIAYYNQCDMINEVRKFKILETLYNNRLIKAL